VTLQKGYSPEQPLRIDPLIYSTYLGGSGDERGIGHYVATEMVVCVVIGTTNSESFPTTAGVVKVQMAVHTIVQLPELDSTGSQLLYSTYLGGSGNDFDDEIAYDDSGTVLVTGYTQSANFPENHVIGPRGGMSDCFISKLNRTGSQLIFSTLFGGSNDDHAYGNSR